MVMSASVLAAEIQALTEESFPEAFPDGGEASTFANVLASAIIDHITSNAVVTVTGVTAGGATAPGTIA